MQAIWLSEIYIYPVKSLGGIKVDNWSVTSKGLLYDRQWMVIDKNFRFISQRQLPKMALIGTSLRNDCLVMAAQGFQELAIPLHTNEGTSLEVAIWQDRCLSRTVSSEADEWLSTFLQTECRLVYMPEETERRVDPEYGRASDKVYFSDGFPFLLISESSLAYLNQRMNLQFSMARFRPNLVVSGCERYAEDNWRSIRIGSINFRLPKPCSRCSVTTIDPETGQSGKEPLLTLNRTRKWNQKVYFGQNAIHDESGELSVGDRLLVYSSGSLQPPISGF